MGGKRLETIGVGYRSCEISPRCAGDSVQSEGAAKRVEDSEHMPKGSSPPPAQKYHNRLLVLPYSLQVELT
jgi:hypothetical protein